MNTRNVITISMLVVLSILLASGCANKYARMYDGPELPPEQVALLKILGPLNPKKVDGKSTSLMLIGDAVLEMKPGLHTYDIEYAVLYTSGNGRHRVETAEFKNVNIMMKPGRIYYILSDTEYKDGEKSVNIKPIEGPFIVTKCAGGGRTVTLDIENSKVNVDYGDNVIVYDWLISYRYDLDGLKSEQSTFDSSPDGKYVTFATVKDGKHYVIIDGYEIDDPVILGGYDKVDWVDINEDTDRVVFSTHVNNKQVMKHYSLNRQDHL